MPLAAERQTAHIQVVAHFNNGWRKQKCNTFAGTASSICINV